MAAMAWHRCQRHEEAYVHDVSVAEMVKKAADAGWKHKPTHFIPASDGTTVTLTGELQAIEEEKPLGIYASTKHSNIY